MLAMAQDGLIFRSLGKVHNSFLVLVLVLGSFYSVSKVHNRFQTPVIATSIGGLVTAVLAMIFDLSSLVDMMSIGTLMAYMMVAASVLVLHYQPGRVGENLLMSNGTGRLSVAQLFNLDAQTSPDGVSALTSQLLLVTYMLVSTAEAYILAHHLPQLQLLDPLLLSLAMTGAVLMGLLVFFLALQPRNQEELTFRTPMVPFLPALAIFVNIYLMMKLSLATWIRFLVWLTVGLVIYFTYGWRNSSEELRARGGFQQETQEGSNSSTNDDFAAPAIDGTHNSTNASQDQNVSPANIIVQ